MKRTWEDYCRQRRAARGSVAEFVQHHLAEVLAAIPATPKPAATVRPISAAEVRAARRDLAARADLQRAEPAARGFMRLREDGPWHILNAGGAPRCSCFRSLDQSRTEVTDSLPERARVCQNCAAVPVDRETYWESRERHRARQPDWKQLLAHDDLNRRWRAR